MKKSNRVRLLTILVLLAALLAGCGGNNAPAGGKEENAKATPETASDSYTVKYGSIGATLGLQAFWWGLDRGVYKDAGINLNVMDTDSFPGPQLVAAYKNG
ncbi:MAG TPA: hypothetical protein VN441_01635 [Syntrophomonas sp.]|nr:hypothetical protein [Syntrophomonas sp.]